jgi:hypothetical protein
MKLDENNEPLVEPGTLVRVVVPYHPRGGWGVVVGEGNKTTWTTSYSVLYEGNKIPMFRYEFEVGNETDVEANLNRRPFRASSRTLNSNPCKKK